MVCGGLSTEPTYIYGLRLHLGSPTVSVRVRAKGVSPAQLICLAARHRDHDSVGYDDVWCVVDVDEFDIDVAVGLARAERINLAVSNPCFEVWLLLHHEDCRTHLASHDTVCTRLRKHIPRYEKTELDFADYSAGVHVAVARAKVLDPGGTNHARNPSTGVWRLVEKIMEWP